VPIDTKLRDASKAGIPPHLFDVSTRGVEAYRSLLKFLQQKMLIDEQIVPLRGAQ
jgi:chromosome partitioning protein